MASNFDVKLWIVLLAIVANSEGWALDPRTDFQRDPAKYEERLNQLAASPERNERIEAAVLMGDRMEKASHLEILWKLLEDGDLLVRGEAALAAGGVALGPNLSPLEAAKLADHFQMLLEKSRPLLDATEPDKKDVWLMGCYAFALRRLCYSHPVMSVQKYQALQRSLLLPLLRDAAPYRQDKEYDIYFVVLQLIDQPDEALEALGVTWGDKVDELDPQLAVANLRFYRTHVLFGVDRPLRDKLKSLIAPRERQLRTRVLKSITDPIERRTFEYYLDELVTGV